MNFEEIRYQQIEDYLKGKLSKEETVSFEKNIASDKNLAEEVAVQKVALQSLEMAYMQSMSTLIRNRVQKNNTIKKYWFGGGALLLTGLLVGSSYLILTSAPTVKEKNESIKHIESNSAANSNDRIINKNTSNTNDNAEAQRNKQASVSLTDSSSLTYQKNNDPIHPSMQNNESAASETKSNTQVDVPDSKIENQQTTTQVTCPDHAPEISVQITPSSYDEQSGSIHINMPDKWNVYLKGVNATYENKKNFTDLAVGTYTLYVKNENNCIFQIGSYTVTNSNCYFEKNYVFNKQFDTEWKIPAYSTTAYQVSIFNKGGIEVFSENVPAYGSTSWNGLNKNGEKAAVGLHKVIVTYPDNKTCIYNVVVSE